MLLARISFYLPKGQRSDLPIVSQESSSGHHLIIDVASQNDARRYASMIVRRSPRFVGRIAIVVRHDASMVLAIRSSSEISDPAAFVYGLLVGSGLAREAYFRHEFLAPAYPELSTAQKHFRKSVLPQLIPAASEAYAKGRRRWYLDDDGEPRLHLHLTDGKHSVIGFGFAGRTIFAVTRSGDEAFASDDIAF